MNGEERAAIDVARRGPLASDTEVEAFWARRDALHHHVEPIADMMP